MLRQPEAEHVQCEATRGQLEAMHGRTIGEHPLISKSPIKYLLTRLLLWQTTKLKSMATRPKNSEVEILELYRVALSNTEAQPEISAVMAELGYDAAKIAEGKKLLSETRAAYDHNKTEDDETSEASALFSAKKDELKAIYKVHRRKARVVFRTDSLSSGRLAISEAVPRAYIKWMEVTKKFYSIASTDEIIQAKLSRLAITPESLIAGSALIDEIEAARSEYLKEVGESQKATKAKDQAFARMDDWMSEFFAVARIGLEDKPQLLEAIGKIVR